MISLTHHADCETIGSHIFGSNGETWVFATGEEIVANRKNEMNTKNFKVHPKKTFSAFDHSTKS
jgi:hypothetical protein